MRTIVTPRSWTRRMISCCFATSGRVIAEGRPDEVKRHPAVIAAYLRVTDADPTTAPAAAETAPVAGP